VGVEVVESEALDLLSVFISPAVLLSEVDLVSAVGFFMSFEVSKVKRIRQANKMGRLKSRPHFLSQPLRDPPHTRPGAAAGPRAPAALADSKRHGTLLLLIDALRALVLCVEHGRPLSSEP